MLRQAPAVRRREVHQRLQEAVQKQNQGGTPEMQLYLAIAHFRLDQATCAPQTVGLLASPQANGWLLGLSALPVGKLIAQEWLIKAERQIETALEKKDNPAEYPSWELRLRWKILRQEAEELFSGKQQAGE